MYKNVNFLNEKLTSRLFLVEIMQNLDHHIIYNKNFNANLVQKVMEYNLENFGYYLTAQNLNSLRYTILPKDIDTTKHIIVQNKNLHQNWRQMIESHQKIDTLKIILKNAMFNVTFGA